MGCPACGGTGYHGRTTISEILVMSDDIRRLVLREVDTAAIARTAVAEGMTTMYLDGMRKALAGLVTPDEVLSVTRDT
jgi:general secretion pathway protein E